MAPDWLVSTFVQSNGRIDGSTATFGAPFYGDRVLGRLVYSASRKNKTHCTEDDYDVPPPAEFKSAAFKNQEVRLINIILVRRGECSFTTKVKVAAKKGAHAVLIVDKEDSKLTTQDLKNIIVADDGFGGTINIPSVLITREDGNKLIAAMDKEQVIVELAWAVPSNHVVHVDLWMSSGSAESLKFLKDFAPSRRKMNEVVGFQPHYAVFGMDGSSPHIYNDLCLDETGAFCAEDPDGPGPVTGKQVLMEDVRQLCIHNLTKVINDRVQKEGTYGKGWQEGTTYRVEYAPGYWNYLEQFHTSCSVADGHFSEECSSKLMKKVGIDEDKVRECVRTNTQAFLRNEREHPAWSPRALRINGWRYSGILDAKLVTRAICSGFIVIPKECKDLTKTKRDPTVPYTAKVEGLSLKEMAGWFFLLAAFIFAVMLLYKRYLKKEMRTTLREEVMLEVQAQMGEYTKMRGNG